MVADGQVTEAADGETRGEPDRCRVHQQHRAVAAPADQWQGRDDAAGDAAEQRETAVPDHQDLQRVARVDVEVVEHVEQPRTDDDADADAEQHLLHRL